MTREQQMADLLERCASVLATLAAIEEDMQHAGLWRARAEVLTSSSYLGHAKRIVLEALQETT